MEPPNSTLVYLMLLGNALPSIGLAIWGFVKWFGARTVAKADKEQDAIEATLKDPEKRLVALEKADVSSLHMGLKDHDKRVTELERGSSDVRAEMRSVVASVESLRGMVAEVRTTVDSRMEKQAEAHRAGLKEIVAVLDERTQRLEHGLRQEMTRAMADAGAMRTPRKRR